MVGTRNQVTEVKAIDFTEYLKRYGITYYMKIDIEGSDIACLKALLSFELKPDYLSAEYVSFDRLVEEISLLEQLGYRQFKAVQQENVAYRVVPSPSREGMAVSYQFELSSSGVFGKELPGKWRNKRQILTEFKRIFVFYRLGGVYSPWTRYKINRIVMGILGKILRRPIPGWHDIHARHASAAP